VKRRLWIAGALVLFAVVLAGALARPHDAAWQFMRLSHSYGLEEPGEGYWQAEGVDEARSRRFLAACDQLAKRTGMAPYVHDVPSEDLDAWVVYVQPPAQRSLNINFRACSGELWLSFRGRTYGIAERFQRWWDARHGDPKAKKPVTTGHP
jgi:hypothetical protein